MATLYRKYRSKTFEEVIGQEPIVTTLKNQIKAGRVGHAYLFAGSRGVGKTTCARIFARAVNCLTPVDGSPCGQCDVCKKLELPDNVDIIEMDAASNNGVDDARDIREKVKYLPVVGKYKVYIIDEVHMLTGGAFNALLKTIEEPPEHVIFILATTEPQKLPQTILSRCIRFDFKLVANDVLAKHIANVYDKEGIKYEQNAIEEIARLGEGSVRDALSVADMLASAADTITLDVVRMLTGAGDSSNIAKLFDCVASRNVAGALSAIDELACSGKSMSAVSRQLNVYARNVLVVKAVGGEKALSNGLLNANRSMIDALNNSAKIGDVTQVARMLDKFGAAENGLKYSVSPRLYLETSIVAIICGADEDDDLRKRVSALERKLNSVAITTEQKKNITTDNSRQGVVTEKRTEQRGYSKVADECVPPPPPPPAEYSGAYGNANSNRNGNASVAKTQKTVINATPIVKPFAPPPHADVNAVLEYSSADEGEFMHMKGRGANGVELLGKIATLLRKTNDSRSARVRELLARGVRIKEREDAMAFIVADANFMAMSDDDVLQTLNAALDQMGYKKRAKIEKTADDLYNDDLALAKELFSKECVVPKKPKKKIGQTIIQQ